jgi:LCP family protein required for cell wall assembly
MSTRSDGPYQGHFAASKKKKARRISGGVLVLLVLLLSLVRLGAEGFKLMAYADVYVGGGKLLRYKNVEQVEVPDLPDNPVVRLDDGTTILYQGHTYKLNQDLVTLLFLGSDHSLEEEKTIGRAGQSDVMLLVGLDTKTGQTTVMNISRETNAQVDIYSVGGYYVETRNEQITLAFAYGDGKEGSCENAMRSVSRLLYGLPISTYLALDMNGIQAVNDAVGHVKVKSLIDVDMPDGTHISEGDLFELQGQYLDRYIRTRTQEIDANAQRMERQKQYVTELSKLAVAKTKRNFSFPAKLFSALAPYMVTDLTIPDVTFLSSSYIAHEASFSFRDIKGSFGKLNGSTIFYPDEPDLFEAALQLFYTRVD